ncbi:hypothetical protein ACFLQR_03085 [Verrucomicrobiota bacterium]
MPVGLLVGFFYYVTLSIELMATRKYLYLELRMKGVRVELAEALTLGLYSDGKKG